MYKLLIKKSHFIVLIVMLFITNNSAAQTNKLGNWFVYFGNQKINKKWNWHNEVQYRNYNFIGDISQLLLRTGIGYNLTENNNNVLLGYGFIQSYNYINADEKVVSNEHRIYQQFITKQSINNFYLLHRYRIEERFLAADFKVRFRYFLSINKPINKKEMEKNALYFSAYNELFINAAKPVFDRNRLYAGAGFCINKEVKFELGYMTQMFENRNQSQFQIILFNNIPFK
jgi:Protein of unknown function (DUF2490)